MKTSRGFWDRAERRVRRNGSLLSRIFPARSGCRASDRRVRIPSRSERCARDSSPRAVRTSLRARRGHPRPLDCRGDTLQTARSPYLARQAPRMCRRARSLSWAMPSLKRLRTPTLAARARSHLRDIKPRRTGMWPCRQERPRGPPTSRPYFIAYEFIQ